MAKNFISYISIIFFIVTILLFPCDTTLSKSDRKSNKFEKRPSKSDSHHSSNVSSKENQNITSVDYQEIITEHKSYSLSRSMIRNFDNEVLAYVTPWNNHGYDVGKIFASKFTMISPVWLQMKPKESNIGVAIEGLHDIDIKWISTLREVNKKIKIVPRIIFEQWNYMAIKNLYTESTSADDVSAELLNLAKKKKFDGYVIEIWSILGGQLKMQLTSLLIKICSTLRQHGIDLILVIPPPSFSGGQVIDFTRQDFENLADHVTAFSLMTYDFSSPQRPGPNSPFPWLIQCIQELVPDKNSKNRKKLLVGLNFYGNDYSSVSSKPIVGHEYIKILEKFKPKFFYHNDTGEHSLTYWSDNNKHEVFYPTLYSIKIRLQLAEELHTGISIWEIGQGLDYFYDLL